MYGSRELVMLEKSGQVAWRVAGDFSGGVRHRPGVLVAVRTLDGSRLWTVIDALHGTEKWREPTDHSLDALLGDIAVGRKTSNDDRCFDVSMEASRVDGVSRRPLWRQLSVGAYDENFSKLFACSAEGVFLAKGRSIVAFDLVSGTERWRSDVSDLGGTASLEAHPMVAGDVCVVATKTWTAGFAVDDGRRLWSTPVWGAHVVYRDRVYVIQHDTLHAFDLFDGSIRFQCEVATEMEKKGRKKFQYIATALAASETHIWCGDPFGTLWALNRATGSPEWHHRPKGTTGYMGGVPAISGNCLYIPSFSMDRRFPPSLYCYQGA